MTAVTVTKRIDATSRSLADVSRTVLIWGFGLAATKLDYCPMENLRLWVNLVQLAGFAVLVLGVLVYHNVIVVLSRDKASRNRDYNLIY